MTTPLPIIDPADDSDSCPLCDWQDPTDTLMWFVRTDLSECDPVERVRVTALIKEAWQAIDEHTAAVQAADLVLERRAVEILRRAHHPESEPEGGAS